MAYRHFNEITETGLLRYLTDAQGKALLYMLVRADQHTGRLFITARILAQKTGMSKDYAKQVLSILARMDVIRTDIDYHPETGQTRLIVRIPDADHVEAVIDYIDPLYARAAGGGKLNIARVQKVIFAEGAKSPTETRNVGDEQLPLIAETGDLSDEITALIGRD